MVHHQRGPVSARRTHAPAVVQHLKRQPQARGQRTLQFRSRGRSRPLVEDVDFVGGPPPVATLAEGQQKLRSHLGVVEAEPRYHDRENVTPDPLPRTSNARHLGPRPRGESPGARAPKHPRAPNLLGPQPTLLESPRPEPPPPGTVEEGFEINPAPAVDSDSGAIVVLDEGRGPTGTGAGKGLGADLRPSEGAEKGQRVDESQPQTLFQIDVEGGQSAPVFFSRREPGTGQRVEQSCGGPGGRDPRARVDDSEFQASCLGLEAGEGPHQALSDDGEQPTTPSRPSASSLGSTPTGRGRRVRPQTMEMPTPSSRVGRPKGRTEPGNRRCIQWGRQR